MADFPQVAIDAAAGFNAEVDLRVALKQAAGVVAGLKSGSFTGEEQLSAKGVGQKPLGLNIPSV